MVGDIHGESRRLRRALDRLANTTLSIVFVGDYVNRGPDSRGVLDQLFLAKRRLGERVTLLRGNHDQALIDFLDGGDPQVLVAHGGVPTARSYLDRRRGGFDEFRDSVPQEHLALLNSTEDSFETDSVLVSHAGFNPSDPSSRSAADMRGAGFRAMFDHVGTWPSPLTVCGHFIQRDQRPFLSDRLICLDTGCGSVDDGPLTALYLPSRDIETF
ncbi:metallophosphoesterase [Nocardioides euryhalodurans]|uniref:metallophosphoesterase n=1 Tax=Nocardioides euryhalodurans TaxID=2518370 RepID=UPI001FC9C3EB|nr:metallophosphoesterase [Nocardioides euryhalodurans]